MGSNWYRFLVDGPDGSSVAFDVLADDAYVAIRLLMATRAIQSEDLVEGHLFCMGSRLEYQNTYGTEQWVVDETDYPQYCDD